ncbi:MAG: hypothetical protein JSS10_08770 [Verrucomicrobia bacterium]|nr:hypothetical protein [Verrucomicrobiota bacterium]
MAKKTEEIPLVPSLRLSSEAMDRSGIQDSYCYRAVSLARALSYLLVDDKGHFHLWEGTLSHFYTPLGTSDGTIHAHQSNFLRRWNRDREFIKKFRKFSLPLCHKKTEEMVRATLLIPAATSLTDADVRRAAVCACLTPLRQSVGSCFATAPAILVQCSHLELLIDDLYELLTAGRLRRVVEGIQYTVPFSLSFGVGDLRKVINPSLEFWASPGLIAALETAQLIPREESFEQKISRARDILLPLYRSCMTVEQLIKKATSKQDQALLSFKSVADNALLKAWEFTLASFCDIKMEFSKWNLSWSLGLNPQEAGGIGEALYEELNTKLQEANKKIDEYHQAVIEAFDQLKAVDSLLNQASTEAEMRRFRAEGQARLHHLRVCEELRDEFQQKAKIYAHFFNFLIRQYTTKFQEYFQEIYDPEMPELSASFYEDRMAGFRLVYKHGRSDSFLWTLIHDPEQFVKALVDFFTITENAIIHACKTAVEKKIVEETTTSILQHVQSERFLKSAMARAGASARLPWSYLSGGTMDQLIPIYFRSFSPLVKESREVHDELDLFIFLLETLKALPPKVTQKFLDDPSQGLLIESPTHAFAILPALFKEGWLDQGFTYTWIRDRFLLPAKEFYHGIKLSSEEQRELMRRLSIEGELFSSASIEMFSAQCSKIPEHELAAFLYRTLPLIPASQSKAVLQKLSGVEDIILPSSMPEFFSSQEIQLLAKAQISSDIDRHLKVADRARELKLAPPACLFADTNWSQGYFAFVVNPISLNLEIWKTDAAGTLSAPLPLIKTWLGKGKQFVWHIYGQIP